MMSQEASVPEDKSEEKGQQLQESAERHKRSGDLMGFIGNTIQSKISGFASASGGLSSLSSASKHEYGPPVSYECTRGPSGSGKSAHESKTLHFGLNWQCCLLKSYYMHKKVNRIKTG